MGMNVNFITYSTEIEPKCRQTQSDIMNVPRDLGRPMKTNINSCKYSDSSTQVVGKLVISNRFCVKGVLW